MKPIAPLAVVLAICMLVTPSAGAPKKKKKKPHPAPPPATAPQATIELDSPPPATPPPAEAKPKEPEPRPSAPEPDGPSKPEAPDPLGGITAGILLGYGFDDAAGFGLGLRGGYTLPIHVYLGGTFIYHFGSSSTAGFNSTSVNVFYLGVEGGYDFVISSVPLVIRPYLGLGPLFEHANTTTTVGTFGSASNGSTGTRLGFWPGVVGLYPVGHFAFGLDLRLALASDETAFTMFAAGLYHF